MRKPITVLMLGLLLRSYACAAPTAPPTPTLALTLTTAHAPETGVTLIVAADKVALPPDATIPPPGASVTDCATAFGLATQTFGAVTALALATMTLLNDQPGEPDLGADVNSHQAFQELAASLSDDQWKALISEGGLGLSDLSDDRQRALFWAQFPHRSLRIVPATTDGKPPDPASATDLTQSLPQVRLRLGQTAVLYAPTRGGSHIFRSTPSDAADGPPHWVPFHDKQPPLTQKYGVSVRADVPNEPKPGDLTFDLPALQATIPLSDLKTVGDLVLRIGHATGLELYADRHYEGKMLTVLGPAPTAPASDLLRALAFCVTGTFRRVGPACVLTDNLTGVAVVHQIWSEFQDRANASRQRSGDEASRTLLNRRSVFDIADFGDPLAPTKQQEVPDPDTALGHFLPQVPRFDDSFAFSTLTPTQQEAARRIVAHLTADNAAEIAKDPSQTPDLNGKWLVSPECTLQALLPGFPQPIEMRKFPLETLVWPPEDIIQPLMRQMEKWEKDHADKRKPAKPTPTLAALLRQTPCRAVLDDPHSPAEVRSLVTTMQKLGLNQLWLYVFKDGFARVPGTPLPQSPDAQNDLLSAALSAAKGTGITVFPVMDLLTWGPSPPPAVRDVNILGETSPEIDARQKEQQSYHDPDDTTPPPGMSVSPFAPEVWTDLSALVKAVAARPGLGGLVWRETDPTGYDNASGNTGSLDDQLGYMPPARLAFLRRAHADPWDITASGYSNLDFHLPTWDDDTLEGKLQAEWSAFRAAPDLALLRTLYATAQAAAPAGLLPVIVQTRRTETWVGDWYGTWDNIRSVPPTYHGGAETGDYEPGSDTGARAQSKTQSKAALATIAVKSDDESDDLAARMDNALNGEKGNPWDGFVLDIAAGDGGPGVAGLRVLAGTDTMGDKGVDFNARRAPPPPSDRRRSP